MLLKLIWKLDKWAHLCGAFTLTTVAIRITGDPMTAFLLVGTGSVLLEVYQHAFEPDYPTKGMDTALDLVADGAGIAVAILVWP